MNPDIVSPAVARALKMAGHLATGEAASAASARHVLLALFASEPEGRATVAAVAAGLDVDGWLPGDLTLGPESMANPAWADDTDDIFLAARNLAREYTADRLVTGDLLLLAIVTENPPLADELTLAGLAVEKLEENLLGEVRTPLEMASGERQLPVLASGERQLPVLETAIPGSLRSPLAIADRVLDANANRAREALRVLEEYARFALDDHHLTQALKQLRHDLGTVCQSFGTLRLVQSRDTPGDVGTSISTTTEQRRESLAAIVTANAKRVQEALRVLEEFAKLRDDASGFERLRYRSYTLEKSLLIAADSQARLAHARLYLLLSGPQCTLEMIAEAAAGGVAVVQLREKEWDDARLLARAREARQWCREVGVLFIVNDRPDLARLVDADGVHLGQDDLSVRDARRIVGPDALIGVSTHDLDQVRRAIADGAGYLGVGPTFPSPTKRFATFPGLDFVRAASAETSLPTFVLGGITSDNLPQVIAAGGRRIAVASAIADANDPRLAAVEMNRMLEYHP